MPAPTMTFNAAGNVLASQSLAASANVSTSTLDYSAIFEGQVHVKNTPGGAVSATRGVQVDVYRRYGSTPTTGESAFLSMTLPSETASTAESVDLLIPTGKYLVKLTNLDATNAVTVEITADTVNAVN